MDEAFLYVANIDKVINARMVDVSCLNNNLKKNVEVAVRSLQFEDMAQQLSSQIMDKTRLRYPEICRIWLSGTGCIPLVNLI